MAGALPSGGYEGATPRGPYGHQSPPQMAPLSTYQSAQQYYSHNVPYDAAMSRAQMAQQQQYVNAHYGQASGMPPHGQGYPPHQQMHYNQMDPYAYAMNAAQYSPLDPRLASPSSFGLPAVMSTEMGQYSRRSSTDTGPVPTFPRGPPRKPKQSGHALWVGNLPPAATVIDLKDHFSRDATNDIESVFLISKSNCAFVNYRSEAACASAMERFHDSRFNGVRLVCRLRRGSAASGAVAGDSIAEASPESSISPAPTDAREESQSPDISSALATEKGKRATSSRENVGTGPPLSDERVPEKYFIVKSLTAQDLEASVRNKVWATQSHNEENLSRAYGLADNVYLIFSANKSGEYFGYARMTSPISGEPVNLFHMSNEQSDKQAATEPTGAPQSILTPATSTAPRGRIIDDSARGTIFWEADHDEEEDELPESERAVAGDGQNWGRQFSVEWVSTTRLPFYRTRGLRNPWNANREVKIARDGTELEPSVGRRLVQMFHRPAPNLSGPSNKPGGLGTSAGSGSYR